MRAFVQSTALHMPVTLSIGRATKDLPAGASDPNYQEIRLVVRPFPLGWSALVRAACPPDFFVGPEAEKRKIDEAHEREVLEWIELGYALRDELTAQFPGASDRAKLIAYAAAVRTEVETAGLLIGHIAQIRRAANLVNQGIGDLGNGSPR